jgi:hypothetical protein
VIAIFERTDKPREEKADGCGGDAATPTSIAATPTTKSMAGKAGICKTWKILAAKPRSSSQRFP